MKIKWTDLVRRDCTFLRLHGLQLSNELNWYKTLCTMLGTRIWDFLFAHHHIKKNPPRIPEINTQQCIKKYQCSQLWGVSLHLAQPCPTALFSSWRYSQYSSVLHGCLASANWQPQKWEFTASGWGRLSLEKVLSSSIGRDCLKRSRGNKKNKKTVGYTRCKQESKWCN